MLTNFKKKLIVIGTLAASLSMAGCGLIGTSASRTEKPTADLVIYNAQITTQEKSLSTASALAIKGETILKVGDDEAVLDMVDDNTQVINANNRRLIPGLVDSHSHFLRSGLAYTRELRWDGVPSLKRGLEMIKEQAARTPEGEWVRVIGGWTPWQFSEKRPPTPAELNEIAPNTPVYIQYFYSVGIVNNKAMEILGIDQSTPDPHQGRFVRDAIGKPTGLMLAEPHPGIFYGKIAALPGTSKEVEANSTMHLFSELTTVSQRWIACHTSFFLLVCSASQKRAGRF
jgi:predicted amidohydrolase YtcJ